MQGGIRGVVGGAGSQSVVSIRGLLRNNQVLPCKPISLARRSHERRKGSVNKQHYRKKNIVESAINPLK